MDGVLEKQNTGLPNPPIERPGLTSFLWITSLHYNWQTAQSEPESHPSIIINKPIGKSDRHEVLSEKLDCILFNYKID